MTTTALQNLLSIEYGKREYNKTELLALLDYYEAKGNKIEALKDIEAKSFPNLYAAALSLTRDLPEDKTVENIKKFIINHPKVEALWVDDDIADFDVVIITSSIG